MDYDFSFVKASAPIAPIALKTVYVVNADRSYDVKRGINNGRNLIALRTLSGVGKIKIEGRSEIILTPDTLLFCRFSEVRSYSCTGDSWDFWWFEFFAGDYHHLSINTLLHISQVENELYDCRSCLEMLRKNETRAVNLASAILDSLIYKWLVYVENGNGANPHQESIQKVIDYITLNPGKTVTLKEMAGIAGLCERRFRQVFTQITGLQPKKFVDEMRIRIAEELLKNTPFSICNISERLGYSNQFHFSIAFRKFHGIPPSEFRNKFRSN